MEQFTNDPKTPMALHALYPTEQSALLFFREQGVLPLEINFPGKNLTAYGAVRKQRRNKGRKSSV